MCIYIHYTHAKDILFYQWKFVKNHLLFNNISMCSTKVSLTLKKKKYQKDSLDFVYVISIPLVTKSL